MRSFVALVSLGAAVGVYAAAPTAYPACGTTCATAAFKLTNCTSVPTSSNACVCESDSDSAPFENCLNTSCTPTDALIALEVIGSNCADVNGTYASLTAAIDISEIAQEIANSSSPIDNTTVSANASASDSLAPQTVLPKTTAVISASTVAPAPVVSKTAAVVSTTAAVVVSSTSAAPTTTAVKSAAALKSSIQLAGALVGLAGAFVILA